MDQLKTNGKYSLVKLIIAITGLVTVLSGAALAWYKAISGEPEAKEVREDNAKDYKNIHKTLTQLKIKVEELEKTQSRQGEVLEKQTRRMILFQGVQSGMTSGQLLAKHEALEKKYDSLINRRGGKIAVQVLKKELALERKMRKMAELRAAKSAKAVRIKSKPTKAQITLPPTAPFKRKAK